MLGVLLLVGCTPAAGGVTPFTPEPADLQDKVDCVVNPEWRPDYGTTSSASRLMGSVPDGFTPVDVVLCSPGAREPVVEEHLAGDLCTDDGETVPGLWLVDATGQAINVVWPLDVCGKARGKPDTAKALEALTVSSAKTFDLTVTP